MPFIFWAGLVFLLGCAFCVHFDVFGFRRKLTRKFYSAFSFVIPSKDIRGQRLKFGMASAAAYIFAIFIFIFLASIFLSFGMPYATGDEENKYTGPLGDLFNGILTPVLTFLTFCGLLLTILIQNIQMKATLQELELTRKEMSDSTDALQAQVRNSTAQKFDSNFYEMLKFHINVSEKIDVSLINEEFKIFNEKSSLWIFFHNPNDFRSFFLTNYQLLKYIKDNEDRKVISSEEAKKYANIVRAVLSEHLYALIFLNCSSDRFLGYRKLIEHYKFLEHFVFSDFSDSYTLKIIQEYKLVAFGDSKNLHSFFELKKFMLLSFVGRYISNVCKELESNMEYMNRYAKYNGVTSENLEIINKNLALFSDKVEKIKSDVDIKQYFYDEKKIDFLYKKNELFFLESYNFDFISYKDHLIFTRESLRKYPLNSTYFEKHIKWFEELKK